jgi:endonuclease/exonuclease/phosphatase (EEP) superfamily protein YafD
VSPAGRVSIEPPAPATRSAAGRLARAAVALIIGGAAALSIGYWIGPERHWALALVLYLPYPIHLVPALTAVMLSLGLGRAWRVAALLGLALVLRFVMGLEIQRGDPPEGRYSVRVLSYNIKAYRAIERAGGFDQVAAEMRGHRPDIVALQDANEPSELRRSGRSAVPRLAGLPFVFSFGQFTLASRYPLRNCSPSIDASGRYIDTWVHCIATIGGRDIDLFSAHLPTPRRGLDAARRDALDGVDDWERNVAARMARAEDLARVIRNRVRPVIVAGDLNAPEPSLAVRRLLDSGLRDAFASAGVGFGYTYGHALKPGFSFLRLDHVLVSRELGVAACAVGAADASEHRPVIADVLLDH